MCEQLGVEPDPDKLPGSLHIFPDEVQIVFLIFNYLPDRWDGMSGNYFGKDWTNIKFFLDLYDITTKVDKKIVTFFLSRLEEYYSDRVNKKVEQRRKAEERKAKAGGQQYAHNVKG